MSNEFERLQKLDGISRHRFSVVAAEMLVQILKQRPDVLLSMVAAGEDEFIRIAKQEYASQDFTREDLKRIYARLTRAAANGAADRLELANG